MRNTPYDRCKCPYLIERQVKGLLSSVIGKVDIFCNVNNVPINSNYSKHHCYPFWDSNDLCHYSQYEKCNYYWEARRTY